MRAAQSRNNFAHDGEILVQTPVLISLRTGYHTWKIDSEIATGTKTWCNSASNVGSFCQPE